MHTYNDARVQQSCSAGRKRVYSLTVKQIHDAWQFPYSWPSLITTSHATRSTNMFVLPVCAWFWDHFFVRWVGRGGSPKCYQAIPQLTQCDLFLWCRRGVGRLLMKTELLPSWATIMILLRKTVKSGNKFVNRICKVWMFVCVGFVMCGCFGNLCTCIYCVLYCLYCVLYCLYCVLYCLYCVLYCLCCVL